MRFIGSIKESCGNKRIGIYWNGKSLCVKDGAEIDDGNANTIAIAKQLAAWLWCWPGWEYRPASN